MKRINLIKIVVTISIIVMVPILSIASVTIKGKIVGVNSLTEGGMTPVDSNDPRMALEPDFVMITDTGDYYLIPNVPREVKAKSIYKKVKVIGEVNERYKSIEADEFYVKKRLTFKIKWTKNKWERKQKLLFDAWINDHR
jgi:hypothetical protein